MKAQGCRDLIKRMLPLLRRFKAGFVSRAAGAALAALAAPLPAVAAEDGASGPEEARDPIEEGRVHTVSSLRSKIRKIARGPWAERKRDEVLGYLTALEALGGWEAGRAALEAVWDTDTVIRDRAFGLAEREHHEKLLPTLDDLLEEKDLRRDADLRRRLAHAYAVIASPKSIEKLAELIRSDEPAEVVDEAARALSVHAGAPLQQRREPVRRLVDLYETTYTYMTSIRPEDRIQKQVMTKRWDIYGKTLLATLQALTSQQLTRPLEWRRWWNENKKAPRWVPGR